MNEEKKVKVEGQGQEEPVTSGCPSLVIGKLPSGFDGVEPAEKVGKGFEEAAVDAFHFLNESFIHAPYQLNARPSYFKTVVGDLASALASVVPCESVYKTPDAAMDVVIDNLTPDLLKRICERHGLKKRMTPAEYYTVSEGCKLTRFKATNATRLIAVRKGREGNADLLYEILVDHDNATAVIERDGEMLYQIRTLGLSHRRCLHAAIQVLRSHLAENDGVHRRHYLSRKRRAAERLEAEPTAEDLENA